MTSPFFTASVQEPADEGRALGGLVGEELGRRVGGEGGRVWKKLALLPGAEPDPDFGFTVFDTLGSIT